MNLDGNNTSTAQNDSSRICNPQQPTTDHITTRPAQSGNDATTSGGYVSADCHDVIDEWFPSSAGQDDDLCLSDFDTEMAESELLFNECFPCLEAVFGEQLQDQEHMEMPSLNNNNNEQAMTQDPGCCAGCGGKIVDRFYLLAVDRRWHVSCLTCVECNQSLDCNVTCFARDGNIYCKQDYYRRFAMKKCARCHLDISSDELVMKARQYVYHIHCFTCTHCHKVLSTGEYFGMRDETVYCKAHYDIDQDLNMNMAITGFQPDGSQVDDIMAGGIPPPLPFYNGVGASQKGRPRKRKNQQHHQHMLTDADMAAQLGLSGEELGLTPDGLMIHAPRQKRIRTSFKHQQIRILKSYFSLNQNPDAKDLKQLAQKTGLTKRVLQVWFQNARAKYRRNLLKQDGDKSKMPDSDNIKQSNKSGSDCSEYQELPDIPSSRSPGSLSDMSSTPSLSDLHSHQMTDSEGSHGSSFCDLFTHVTNSMNALV